MILYLLPNGYREIRTHQCGYTDTVTPDCDKTEIFFYQQFVVQSCKCFKQMEPIEENFYDKLTTRLKKTQNVIEFSVKKNRFWRRLFSFW